MKGINLKAFSIVRVRGIGFSLRVSTASARLDAVQTES
jgi:hypothetical protein